MAELFNVADPLRAWLAHPHNAPLNRPDGRALFAYRLSDEQFASLQAALIVAIAAARGLDALSTDHLSFPKCFVLYAAEWWRRGYDGGQLSYARILTELDAADRPWSPTRRGECIDRGLRQWRLPQSSAGGLRYLRAIALQGGLPVALLAAARGSLGGLLTRVLRLALGTLEPSPVLLRGWVASLGEQLPRLYRQEEIYDLLAGVVATVLALRRELGADTNGDTRQRLAQTCPDWRERFPLSIEDANAQALLEQLIRVPVPAVPEDFRCERWLEQTPEGPWRLRATLELPEHLPTGALRTRFGIDDQEPIPRTFELVLSANGETLQRPARRLAGRDQYRLERRGAALTDGAAGATLQLALIAADERGWPAVPKRGEALDPALPWVFEVPASGQTDGTMRWVRQGGGVRARVIPEVEPGAQAWGRIASAASYCPEQTRRQGVRRRTGLSLRTCRQPACAWRESFPVIRVRQRKGPEPDIEIARAAVDQVADDRAEPLAGFRHPVCVRIEQQKSLGMHETDEYVVGLAVHPDHHHGSRRNHDRDRRGNEQ